MLLSVDPNGKMTVTDVGGGQTYLVPMFNKVGGDMSHGSHKVVAPIELC